MIIYVGFIVSLGFKLSLNPLMQRLRSLYINKHEALLFTLQDKRMFLQITVDGFDSDKKEEHCGVLRGARKRRKRTYTVFLSVRNVLCDIFDLKTHRTNVKWFDGVVEVCSHRLSLDQT